MIFQFFLAKKSNKIQLHSNSIIISTNKLATWVRILKVHLLLLRASVWGTLTFFYFSVLLYCFFSDNISATFGAKGKTVIIHLLQYFLRIAVISSDLHFSCIVALHIIISCIFHFKKYSEGVCDCCCAWISDFYLAWDL